MDIDPKSKRAMENMFFEGIVSSQDAASGTVRVTRPDKGDKVTGPMVVGVRGTKATKDFWMPAIGDQVLCLQLPNFSGKGVGEGWVLAARYSNVDASVESDPAVRSVHYADGSYIKNSGGAIEIHASSSITLTAPNIYINE